jgi:hypothetical protein
MSALPKFGFEPWSLPEAVVSDFVRKGMHLLDQPLDARACAAFLAEVRAGRRFDQTLFLSEAEFEAGAPTGGTDNLLERLEPRLGFVERAPQVVQALWSLLGPDYRIVEKKIVCSLPAGRLPDWVKRRIRGQAAEGLAAFVRPEHRGLDYVQGADFHQDLADRPHGGAAFVALHVYLHPVAEGDAPLHVLEGSHRLGAAAYPHDLRRVAPGSWRYRNGLHDEMFVTPRVLTGEAGSAALWHPCMLHASEPPAGDRERISLRYLAARGEAAAAGIDSVNATLAGPLRLADADAAAGRGGGGDPWRRGPGLRGQA